MSVIKIGDDDLFKKNVLNPMNGYKTPVTVVRNQILEQCENDICNAILKVGISVDKEELIKAMQYDRDQYSKGYMNGRKDAICEVNEKMNDFKKKAIEAYGVFICEACADAFTDMQEWILSQMKEGTND